MHRSLCVGLKLQLSDILLTLDSALNILAVKAYGEAEFWLSGGKVILIFMLFA